MNQRTPSNGKRLLNIHEAAAFLGLAPRTIYNGVAPRAKRRFPVPAKRVGRKVLFDIRDLERFVDNLPAT